MLASFILATTLSTSLGVHIQAPSTNLPRQATIQIVSPTATQFDWTPNYDVGQSLALCIASPTGRYELSVQTSEAGVPRGGRPISLVLTFKNGAVAQSQSAIPGQRVIFPGAARPDLVCNGQTTATLMVSLDRDSVIAGVAGDYAIGLDLSLSPR